MTSLAKSKVKWERQVSQVKEGDKLLDEQEDNILEMTSILQKAVKLLLGSFDQTALIQGISDIVVVRWDSGRHCSTPFVVCFGHAGTTSEDRGVRVYVNDILVTDVTFNIDEYGYLHPMRPSQQLLAKLSLRYGRNVIKFQLGQIGSLNQLAAQIYLYSEHDKILVSDMDGTLTKDDIGGFYNNFHGSDYLHDGYYQLLEAAHKNGYKIVWLTMRSLPLYKFSKDYIHKHTKMHGALLTEPEQLLPAFKKELMKQTGNIKTNMMLEIKNLFPSYSTPFVGGLGNRENDAIAYRAAGIPLQNIFIIGTDSKVHQLSNTQHAVTYKTMSESMEKFFPKLKRKSLLKSLTMELELQNQEKKEGVFFTVQLNKGNSI